MQASLEKGTDCFPVSLCPPCPEKGTDCLPGALSSLWLGRRPGAPRYPGTRSSFHVEPEKEAVSSSDTVRHYEWLAVIPGKKFVCLAVRDEATRGRVEVELASKPVGYIRQQTETPGKMPLFQI